MIDIRTYILINFPEGRERKGGEEIMIKCPFHEETMPSLSINLESGIWRCFGCNKRGNFTALYKYFEKVSWREAKEKCSGIYYEKSDKEKKLVNIKLPEGLISCRIKISPYLKSRGFSAEDLEPFDVFWKFSNFMVYFPIYEQNGKLISYASRKASGRDYYYPSESPHMNYLYGENLKLKDKVFIVEGVLDAISVNRAGFSALATFTKQFSGSQLNRLKDFIKNGRCKEYVIMLDADAEEQSDLLQYQLLLMGCKTDQIKLEIGDPGEKSIEEIRDLTFSNNTL